MPTVKDLNAWLSYDVDPANLSVEPHPAMLGNGQVEALAEVGRACVCDAVCFGYGEEGLDYQREEHLVPAVYDVETGRKYFLRSTASSTVEKVASTFRPDRQVWRFRFDDLEVRLTLMLPRLQPGYFFKVEILPGAQNRSRSWLVYHELRGHNGGMLFATEAGNDPSGGAIWLRGTHDCWEAIGASIDAEDVNLGRDGDFAVDIMAKLRVQRGETGAVSPVWLARAFGDSEGSAKAGLRTVLAEPDKAEDETQSWWNTYLEDSPNLTVPDETISKAFLWSWPNYRVNRIDIAAGIFPAGMTYVNNGSLNAKPWLNSIDSVETEAITLLQDPQPARDLILFLLSQTSKHGLLSTGYWNGVDSEFHYYTGLGYLSGLIHRYLLNTEDLALLETDIGGVTILPRLEEALEAQLEYRNETTGLFYLECGDWDGTTLSKGMRPLLESEFRFRGGAGSCYANCNATMWSTFIALAEIENLAGNEAKSDEYHKLADELLSQIRTHMWNSIDAFYCDLNPDGSIGEYRGIGGFMAGLFANCVHRPGGVATTEQAEKLAEWCRHPDFSSDFGVISLSRNSPYFDPTEEKGFNSGFDMHLCNQVPAGLYAHGCHEEAHIQLTKLFRRIGENHGLGPHFRGESYNSDTGAILPWRFPNYPAILSALTSIIEGVFGIRWTENHLSIEVHSPWPWARLENLKVRGSRLDIELREGGELIACVNGDEIVRTSELRAELSWEVFRGVSHRLTDSSSSI